MDEQRDELTFIQTEHAGMVLLYADKICTALGSYGLKVGTDGIIEALMMKPEGTTWETIDELPAVVAGQTILPKRPRRN